MTRPIWTGDLQIDVPHGVVTVKRATDGIIQISIEDYSAKLRLNVAEDIARQIAGSIQSFLQNEPIDV